MRQNTFIISEHLQKQPQATASQSITEGYQIREVYEWLAPPMTTGHDSSAESES
jgi:hypothetical protein